VRIKSYDAFKEELIPCYRKPEEVETTEGSAKNNARASGWNDSFSVLSRNTSQFVKRTKAI
jgi:hypothetical protein